MPKIITPAMRAHLDEDTTRLTAIWRITRTDGAAEPAPSPGRLLRQWPLGAGTPPF